MGAWRMLCTRREPLPRMASELQVTTIPANHPGLYEAARLLELAIDVSTGRYLYP